MSILSFFRRTKSKYADDKAVDDFARVARKMGAIKDMTEAERVEAIKAEMDRMERLYGKPPNDEG